MSKVKISKELKECLDYLIELEGRDWIIKKHAIKTHLNKVGWASKKYKVLNGLSLDFLAKALYEGYEEESKEEVLVRKFKELTKESASSLNRREALGIVEALNTLEIKIDGINK